ncbi:polysaccharide biosynthesis protein [Priestia megaterium]|uniref:polysaccharide biosynthesis protein n=1 Tax=Priestia megaterium TaxID=1404 RepID=UPI003990096A
MQYSLRIFLLSIVDILLLTGTYFLSLLVVEGGELKFNLYSFHTFSSLLIYLFICHICLFTIKSYKTLWRYSGIREILNVIYALSSSNLLYSIYFFIFLSKDWPNILPLTLYFFSTLIICGFRVVWIIKNQPFFPHDLFQKRLLIIGAGDTGTRLVQQILQSKELDYNPVGFIEDNPQKKNTEILGIPVLGGRLDIKNLVIKHDITEIIIAIPSAKKSEILNIINLCKETKASIKILPPVKDVLHGEVSINQIREIDLKDLIGREKILPTERLKNYLVNKSILITGAGGSIGSELANQVAACEPKLLILMGHGENSIFRIGRFIKDKFPNINTKLIITDIQDKHLINQVFEKYRPQIVFHTAAHKHVPLMETNEESAVKNNIFGTQNVAEASNRFGVERFVFISTDKAVHPVNIMGMTKRVGEMIVQDFSSKSSTKFSIVRFGNVLESRGSVIPIFKEQIEAGGPVTVTHPEMVRYFMTIPEAVQLVLEAGALSKGREVFVLDMGEPVKIVDLAKNLICLYGYEPDRHIQIQYTGVRPGEKLSESLLYENEKEIPTDHPHIVIASPQENNHFNLNDYLDKLEKSVLYHPEQLRNILTEIIQKDTEQ